MTRRSFDGRINSDGLNAQFPTGFDEPHGNLAAISDQDFAKQTISPVIPAGAVT
jgi:hypothetical protein